MANNVVTRILITARDEASAVFGALKSRVTLIAGAISAAFGGSLLAGAVNSAREFETALSRVQAASGASAAEMDALKAAAEQAGQTTRYTSVQAADALTELSKAGLSATDAVSSLPAVLDLATAGGTDLATAAGYISQSVAGMGLSFAEAGRVADVLAQGANASNTSVTGLAQALSYAAPIARTVGLSLEDTVAIIGKFADAGIDASRAGTALNSILSQFENPATKFRQELGRLGITTTDFSQALVQLEAKGAAGKEAIRAVGLEAGPALQALLAQGTGSLNALAAKLRESEGSARAFADVVSDNLDGSLTTLGSAWDTLKTTLGTPLLEPIQAQVEALSAKLREFVSSGAAARLGDSLSSAFQAAAKWGREFFGAIDFDELGRKINQFVTDAGQWFDEIGQKAQTAGDIAATGWNGLLAVFGTVRTGMSTLAASISSTLAVIADGVSGALGLIARIAPSFKGAADEADNWAKAFRASAQENLDAATQHAIDTQTAVANVGAALQRLSQDSETAAPKIAETGEALDTAGAAANEAAPPINRAAGAIEQTANAAGQAAGQLDTLSGSTRQAGADAAALANAYQQLGITTQAELEAAATAARASFEVIRNSGTATPRELAAAWQAWAEKAADAQNGVLTRAQQAEGALYRVGQAGTQAGTDIVGSMAAADAALARTAAAAKTTADQIAQIKADRSSFDRDAEGNLLDGTSLMDQRGQITRGGSQDFATALAGMNASAEEEAAARAAGERAYREGMDSMAGAMLTGTQYIHRFNQVMQQAEEAARTAAMAERAKAQRAANAAATDRGAATSSNTRTGMSSVTQPVQTIRLDLGGGIGANLINDAGAKQFIDRLQALQART